MSEMTTKRVSLYGRLTDDLTRDVVSGRAFDAVLSATGQRALRKDDGYFVFTDLAPSATDYEILVSARSYQRRTLAINLPTALAVEVAYPGEDELCVIVTGVDAESRRVSFEKLPFVPTIRAGSGVFGPGDFTATLDAPLEGSEVEFAILSSVVGLGDGALLRFVRSTNLILQPGPYYPFEANTTLVVLKAVGSTAGDPPVGDATITIDQVNAVALTTTLVGGLNLHTVTLAGSPTLLLGPDRAIQTVTNERGDALFYFPVDTPITELRMQITRSGYVSASETIPVTAGKRTTRTVPLDRV
jgi:hypothetical protein